jgi:galactokinase
MLLTELAQAPHLSPVGYAKIAQRSENNFVGTQCGIMDQLIAAAGQESCALRIDCRDLSHSPVPIPAVLGVLIIHSGVERQLASSAYNERRAQCEAVAAHFGVPSLREVTLDQLLGEQDAIADVAFRRARHVLSENARVLAASAALEICDIFQLSELFRASHQSMRDDFAITVPKIDELVALIDQEIGDSGAVRMTGGGFGGCVVALLARDRLPDIMAHVAGHYRTPSGDPPMMIRAEPSAGAFLHRLSPARSMIKE